MKRKTSTGEAVWVGARKKECNLAYVDDDDEGVGNLGIVGNTGRRCSSNDDGVRGVRGARGGGGAGDDGERGMEIVPFRVVDA